MKRYPDVACDLWIINEWLMQNAWATANEDQRGAMLADAMDEEQAGYGLPDEYSADRRVHVFADDDCEVWLGCFDPLYCNSVGLLDGGGAYALLLDDRAVIGVYSMGQS